MTIKEEHKNKMDENVNRIATTALIRTHKLTMNSQHNIIIQSNIIVNAFCDFFKTCSYRVQEGQGRTIS